MLLYHYSVEEYSHLLSLKGQKKEEDKDYSGNYSDSISFFLEPIPRNIASILKHKHKFWKSGAEIYEHVIDTNVFYPDLKYVITETPEKTHLLYNVQVWDKKTITPDLIKQYKLEISDMQEKKGYRGEGKDNFLKAAKKFNHGIAGYYREMVKLDAKYPEDKLMDKYAACVPHAMLYVGEQKVQVATSRLIKLK